MSHSEAISKLFGEAYEMAPVKNKFFDEIAGLPGVVCTHQAKAFCEGYLKSLVENNLPCYGYQIISFQSSSSGSGSGFASRQIRVGERHFLLSDATEFTKACIAMKNRNFVRVPTPRSVLVKMVKLRLDKVYKNAVWFSVHTLARNKQTLGTVPNLAPPVVMDVLNSKEACAEWCLENTFWTHRDGRKALEGILQRDDIPDDVYKEAWDLFEVNMVMDS
jgi:hypothetical protein